MVKHKYLEEHRQLRRTPAGWKCITDNECEKELGAGWHPWMLMAAWERQMEAQKQAAEEAQAWALATYVYEAVVQIPRTSVQAAAGPPWVLGLQRWRRDPGQAGQLNSLNHWVADSERNPPQQVKWRARGIQRRRLACVPARVRVYCTWACIHTPHIHTTHRQMKCVKM